jgi:NTE family protein
VVRAAGGECRPGAADRRVYAEKRMQTPDALVLGGGGTLGEAWMSAVLAGIEDSQQFDARACARYVGTSAGSIVAASLVAGLEPGARLGPLSSSDSASFADDESPAGALKQVFSAAAELAGAAAAPLASWASTSSVAGGAVLRRTLLSRVPDGKRSLAELGRHVELAGVSWDGRLRIVAVEHDSGRRVVFGAPGAPEISVALAVQASCAIPGVFRPISANGRTYVDGGVWSPTNIDAAEARRGERVLCLNPTGSLRPTIGAPAGALGPVSRTIAGAEALVLRNRGATVTTISPDAQSAAAMGTNLMDQRPRQAVIDAGLAQGRRIGARAQRRAA